MQAVERAEVRFPEESSWKLQAESRKIGRGIVVYFGVHTSDVSALQRDSDTAVSWKNKIDLLVEKIRNMRWLKDDVGRLDATLDAVGGEIMVISNFTLYAKNKKGNKMSFSDSASASDAEPIYDYFVQGLRDAWWKVQTGKFAAMMEVSAVTMGPINYVWDV